MKIFEKLLDFIPDAECVLPEGAFYLDIETTGLSSRTSQLYLIGILYREERGIVIRQWFAETLTDEQDMIADFLQFVKPFRMCIHFNGTTFDLPFLKHSAENYHIPFMDNCASVDLCSCLKPLMALLKIENIRQKSLEDRLGIVRQDKFSGKELIDVYKGYCVNPDEVVLSVLLLHNHDDLVGMLKISAARTYGMAFSGNLELLDAKFETLLRLNLKTEYAFPAKADFYKDDIIIKLSGNTIKIMTSVSEKGVKFFFDDYKEYVYLPAEDKSVHKAIGSFVDGEHRQRATFDNCYQYVKPELLCNEAGAVKYAKMLFRHYLDPAGKLCLLENLFDNN